MLSIETIRARQLAFSQSKVERAECIPTEQDALEVILTGFRRLQDLGFQTMATSPRGGDERYDAIEAGSMTVDTCSYDPKKQQYNMIGHHAAWPATPILWRAKK